jgi:plasmid stabilization system protein ParE
LQGAFQRIADGISLGHKRPDVPQELRLKFVVERPFVVAFDESSREIARVVHGARDIGAIFGGR